MITQAGIYKLDLYEDKGVSFVYDANGDITSVSNTGDVLNFETDYNDPRYENNKESAQNNAVLNNHNIKFHIDTLDSSNFDIIEKLQSSIYGYIPKIEFMNGDKYIIDTPFYPTINKLDSQKSHTFNIELNVRVKTYKELHKFV